MLQKDAEASQQAVELLDELETKRNLKLEAEDRSAALQQWVDQDAKVIARLRRERDKLLQTMERLRLEHGTVHEESNRAIQECDEARQVVNSLRADLGAVVTRRLEARSISTGLAKDLAKVRGILQAKSDKHDLLCATVGVVFDDLGVA